MKITSKQKGFRSYFDLSPQIPTRMKNRRFMFNLLS